MSDRFRFIAGMADTIYVAANEYYRGIHSDEDCLRTKIACCCGRGHGYLVKICGPTENKTFRVRASVADSMRSRNARLASRTCAVIDSLSE